MPLSLSATHAINGFVRASLINSRYGLDLLTDGEIDGINIDLETAEMAQSYCDRVRARNRLGVTSGPTIEMIFRDNDHYHLVRAVEGVPDVLIHVVIDRHTGNLVHARNVVASVTQDVAKALLH